jgi:sulfur carrier protein ThiS adenylyltransferase
LSVYEIHEVRITRRNAAEIFRAADVLVEAFDKAEAKEMLIEACLKRFPGRPIVAASGLAGYGGNRKLHTRRMGNLYICGDEASQCPKGVSPMAPRVGIVAHMQANLVVELLVKMKGQRFSKKVSR